MGCCHSTNATKTPRTELPNYQNAPRSHRRHVQPGIPRPKPEPASKERTHVVSPKSDPPVVEEESVKEVVLSETPVLKPSTTPEVSLVQAEMKSAQLGLAKKLEPEPEPEPEEHRGVSEVSLVSESCECEVSESFSYLSTTTTTTTVTEVKDEDEAVSKRRREVGPNNRALNGSPSAAARRKQPYSGELAGRRGRGHVSPAGRPERSADKRNRAETKPVQPGRVGPGRRGGGGGGGVGVRRDAGEASARRSRSPAARSAGGPGRGGVWRGGSRVTGRGGGRPVEEEESSQVGNGESLENPLVALECFIFV